MTHTVPVIFERGVFKPLKKIRLREHQKLIIRYDSPKINSDALRETIAILSDTKLVKRIGRALDHVRRRKLLSHAEVFGHPQPNKRK